MIGLGPEDYTYYPFKYDPTRHNDFKRACRHMLSPASLPASTLSAKFADLLRQGLAPFDMDDRVSRFQAISTLSADVF